MRIAYLVNQYPWVSHSFIRREILALELLGIPDLRIALRGWDDYSWTRKMKPKARGRAMCCATAHSLVPCNTQYAGNAARQLLRTLGLV